MGEQIVKRRFDEVDILKGIAILFIIALHSFSPNPVNLKVTMPFAYRIVCSFPLQLFFLLSGFLFKVDEAWPTFIKKKALRLGLPFLTFGLIGIALKFVFAPYTQSGGGNIVHNLLMMLAGGSGWFIYCLFFIYIINRACYKFRLPVALLMFAIAASGLVNTTLFTIDRIIYYDLFFVAGTYLRLYYDKIQDFLIKRGELILIITISLYGILIYSFPKVFVIDELLLPILAIAGIWTLIYLAMKTTQFSVLKYFGKYSLQFYLNQICLLPIYYLGSFVFRIVHSYQICFFAISLTAVLATWVMLLVEKRCGRAKILFGL